MNSPAYLFAVLKVIILFVYLFKGEMSESGTYKEAPGPQYKVYAGTGHQVNGRYTSSPSYGFGSSKRPKALT